MTTQAKSETLYHFNPDTGKVGVCVAKIQCEFGDAAPHFSSKKDASLAYEASVSEAKKFSSLSKKSDSASVIVDPLELTEKEKELSDKIDEQEFAILQNFATLSPEAHAALDEMIDLRGEVSVDRAARLALIKDGLDKDSDKSAFISFRDRFEDYKNRTATLVEAHLSSPFYVSPAKDLEEGTNVGAAIERKFYEPNSAEWLQERFDSVGGSDVGALAKMDFAPSKKVPDWSKVVPKGPAGIERTKLAMPTQEEIDKNQELSLTSRRGALYRGTVWEDRLRDKFASDHENFTVYNAKGQYFNPERPWQQVNFDGVISDRKDGKPNGILEIKTATHHKDWENGPPLNYRAQTLYYLNSTGFDYAYVMASFNDGERKYFKLHRDDPVAPGKYEGTMEEYITLRVEPWFEGLRKRREG